MDKKLSQLPKYINLSGIEEIVSVDTTNANGQKNGLISLNDIVTFASQQFKVTDDNFDMVNIFDQKMADLANA